jgi:hypothetical protein
VTRLKRRSLIHTINWCFRLCELDIHDAIIVATALIYRELSTEAVVVVTRDEAIIRSGLAQTLW